MEKLNVKKLENYRTKAGKSYKYIGIARKRKARDDNYIKNWNNQVDEILKNYSEIQKNLVEKFGEFKNYAESVQGKSEIKKEIELLAQKNGTSQNQIMRIWGDPKHAMLY